MTPATDSIAPETRLALAGILNVLGLFQSLDRHISVESIKTLLHIALNENKSVHDYARMAGVGGGPMSRRISDLGELDRNLNPGLTSPQSHIGRSESEIAAPYSDPDFAAKADTASGIICCGSLCGALP
jgi:hypothetical protein